MNSKRSTRKHDDLVYDVGMHTGQDTDYYLAKGFRVVAFEADPELAARCRERFASAIAAQRLTIVEGAIVEPPPDGAPPGKVKLYRNTKYSVWSTVSSDWAQRNEIRGTLSEVVEISAVNFAESLERHGMPHYMKIDIEGMDTLCLRALREFAVRPDYVSIESEKIVFGKLRAEIDLLTELGYTDFEAVQQQGIGRQREPQPSHERSFAGYRFREGSSGLFGSDLPDQWKTGAEIVELYGRIFRQYALFGDSGKLTRHLAGKILAKGLSLLQGRPMPGWYDTHARHGCVRA